MPEAPWSASLLEAACQGGRLLCHPAIAPGRASPVPGSCASPSNHPDGLPARKLGGGAEGALGCRAFSRHARSEDHTSELQSLMRNTYAVFCLQKNTTQQPALPRTTHEH